MITAPELARQAATILNNPALVINGIRKQNTGHVHIEIMARDTFPGAIIQPPDFYWARLARHLEQQYTRVGWSTTPINSRPHSAGIVEIVLVERCKLPVAVRPVLMLCAPRVVTRYQVGQVIVIPGTQRKSAILEVDANKTEPFYRVRLDSGIEHAWFSEEKMKKANPRIEVLEFAADVRTKAA